MNFLVYLKNILQIILSPKTAWKEIEDNDAPVEETISRGLYPLLTVVLFSVFLHPVLHRTPFELVRLLQSSVIQFVALFISFHIGRNVMEHYVPIYNETGDKDPVAVANVAAYGTGMMAIIQLIENLLPFELTVIQLLPAFAALCIWKAADYLDLNRKEVSRFMLIGITALIAPVIVINLLMLFLIN